MGRQPLAVLAAAVALTACADRDPLTVGFAMPGHWYRAAQLALEDDSTARVTVVWDTVPGRGGGAGGAMYWAEWLVDQGADVVIGHDASRPSVGAAGVYNREGVLQLAPTATSALLERQGPWSIGLAPTGAVEGAFIVGFADTVLGARRLGLLYNNDEFGLDLRDGVLAAAAARGLTVADQRFFTPLQARAEPDALDPLFAAMLAARPDVVVLAGQYGELIRLTRFLGRRSGAPDVISSDGATVRVPGSRGWPAEMNGVYQVRFWNPAAPASRAFAERFAARWGEPPDDAEALTYDATRLALAAAHDGARTAGQARGWVLQLGRGRPPFDGLATTWSFRDGRPFRPDLWMFRVIDGRLEPATRVAP